MNPKNATAAHHSKAHDVDLRLRQIIWDLWPQLPKTYRLQWNAHPDTPQYGNRFAFWWTNYQRTHDHLPPAIIYPYAAWTNAPTPTIATATAAGSLITGTIDFRPDAPDGVLAIAVSRNAWGSTYATCLRTLIYISNQRQITYRLPNEAPGWHRVHLAMYTPTGFVQNGNILPPIFCK